MFAWLQGLKRVSTLRTTQSRLPCSKHIFLRSLWMLECVGVWRVQPGLHEGEKSSSMDGHILLSFTTSNYSSHGQPIMCVKLLVCRQSIFTTCTYMCAIATYSTCFPSCILSHALVYLFTYIMCWSTHNIRRHRHCSRRQHMYR